MEINFTATNPEELKLTGEFILRIARVREAAAAGVGSHDATRRESAHEPEAVIGVNVAAFGAATPGASSYSREPEVDKPKRTRRTKAEMEAARAAEQQEVEQEPAGESAAAATEQEEHGSASVAPSASADGAALTLDDARNALQAFVAKHGMPDAMVLLKEFGVERVSEVPADRYAEFIEKAGV